MKPTRDRRTIAALRATRARQQQLLAIPLPERIAGNYTVTDDGCWQWQGYRYGNGYAALSWQGRQQLLHRLTYEHFVGPIPDGLVIDHLCRNKSCINPDHMEVVTSRENTRRAMRTHCVNGHEFTPENTYIPADGKRYCRECRRQRVRDQRARAKEASRGA